MAASPLSRVFYDGLYLRHYFLYFREIFRLFFLKFIFNKNEVPMDLDYFFNLYTYIFIHIYKQIVRVFILVTTLDVTALLQAE